MKLRNKQTGEILESARSSAVVKDKFRIYDELNDKYYTYNSLGELNAEWEDYEEPKEYWFLSTGGEPHRFEGEDKIYSPNRKSIGNYFETREEAEKAVEKLKAWKRLKDNGFEFCGWIDTNNATHDIWFALPDEKWESDICDDLDLLFGGEE